eukprot:COSAG01_NODE_7072_length_3367_cov_2.824051_1_plen_209_part_00
MRQGVVPPLPPPPGIPGTCAEACGPVSACDSALLRDCGAARAKGGDSSCIHCAGAHQSELHAAGCAASDVASFCAAPVLPPPVKCSVKGNCFNISGAHNFHPPVPAGTDLNGQYYKTNHTCYGKYVWQKGGGGGAALYQDEGSQHEWLVGTSNATTDCSSWSVYLTSGYGSCPSSPDGVGCVGKWHEMDSGGTFRPNHALRCVASTGR